MTNQAEALACTCAHVADERKAEQVVVLHVEPLTFVSDYFVIATGLNERQIAAIATQVRQRAARLGHRVIGVEGEADCGWVLIDLGDVVVEALAPFQERVRELEADKAYTLDVLKRGAEHAEAIAARTLAKVRERLGFVPRPG